MTEEDKNKLAAMSDDEKRMYEELYIKYTLALRKLETEMYNLFDAYKFITNNEDNNIVKYTKSRIKTFDSASKKLSNKGVDTNLENIEKVLRDMVGFRIVCPFENDVYKIVNLVKSCDSFVIEKEKDYIVEPKESGYSSYHIDVAIPIKFKGENVYVHGEIQVRTMAMDLWATLDHIIRYKTSHDVQDKLSQEFLARANDMKRFDQRMQILREEVSEMMKTEEKDKERENRPYVKKR